MKHIKNLTLLLALSLVLGGCNVDSSISTNESTSSSDTSSTSTSQEPEKVKWSKDQQILLLEFFGELLPYPSGFSGEVAMYQDELNGTPRLTIGNVADEFTIKNYTDELQNKGWTGVYNYNGGGDLTFGKDTPIYYCLKSASDGTSGYILSYYFIEPTEETDEYDASPGYNVICAYKNVPTTVSDATYTDEDNKNFKSAITTIPPQLKLADGAIIYQGSRDVIVLSDFGAIDLRKDNLDILKNDGFTIDEDLSKTYAVYVLRKTLSDGSSILASLDFYYGNYITFQYLANIKTYSSWPSELDDEFEDKYGITIPEFKDGNVDVYNAFVKNGTTYIYQLVDEETSSLENTVESLLYDIGLSCDNNRSYYTDWNERYFVSKLAGYGDDDKRLVGIVFGEMEQEHDFIYGYRDVSTKIKKFLDKNEITTAFPSLNELPYGSYRYEEDDYSINISFFDPSINWTNEIKEYLRSVFVDALWYDDGYNPEYDEYFESPDGKIGVGLTLNGNVTTLSITEGNGEEHKTVFEFDEKTKYMVAGDFGDLNIISSMCSSNVTYVSSDSNVVSLTDEHSNWISVSEEATVGTQVTITATTTDANGDEITATCTIVIVPSYTAESAVTAVADSYNTYYNLTGDNAVTVTTDINTDDPYVTITTCSLKATISDGNVKTVEDAESFIENNLISLGFELLEGEEWVESTTEDGLTQYSISYYFALNDIHLNFVVYVNASNELVIEASAETREEHWDDEEDDGDFDDEELD